MSINKYQIVRRIKWGIYYILRNFIKLENMIFKPNNKKIQRLFSTTGNISLINALAIINSIGNFDKYDDILVIDSGKGDDAFMQKQLEIAKHHKFKKILASPRINPGVQIVLNNIWNVDEIYLLNHPMHINTILPLFLKAPVYLFDEGAASLMDYGIDKIKNLKKFITHRYLGKLDFLGLENPEQYKFEQLDKKYFTEIANKVVQKAPINLTLDKDNKYILYCGIYWEVTGLSREKFIEIQSNMLNELLNAGYKILYKPHPRDNEFFGFDTNPNVIFIDSKFPIELYNLDVVAIVSVSSTTSITPAHYWNIPSFSNVIDEALVHDNKDKVSIDIIRRIVKEYSPNYKELLNFDVKNISKEELSKQIKQFYDTFLQKKPLLSENQNIKDMYYNE